MISGKPILFIGHAFHGVTKSSAFFRSLLDELGQVEEIADDSLDGNAHPVDYRALVEAKDYFLVVVWQLEYVAAQLAGLENVVFVPMFDGCKDLPPSYWTGLGGMRILAFSIPVYVRAQEAGCKAQYCQYWPETDAHLAARPKTPGKGFYWYRRNDLDLDRLEAICRDLGIEHLDILWRPDPPVAVPFAKEDFRRRLPVAVEFVDWADGRDAQLERIAGASIYIASRSFEGIGMAFLEAMSLGCCVVAPRNPTYTDYIVSGDNGLLFDRGFVLTPSRAEIADRGRKAAETARLGRARWLENAENLKAWLAEEKPFEFFRLGLPASIEPAPAIEPPLVTVVTVVRNAAAELRRTIDSVLGQEGIAFDYVVMDGASTDATLAVAQSYGDRISTLVSQPDEGPYDAMNRSLGVVRGAFVIFMNAGDRFVSPTALRDLMEGVHEDHDFVVGHCVYRRSNGVEELHRVADFRETYQSLVKGKLNNGWHSGIPGHQATATRAALLGELRYDISMTIAADHDLLFKAAARGSRFLVKDLYVAIYEGGGLSEKHYDQCVRQWLEIGLKHSESKKAVWSLYTPRLLPLFLQNLREAEGWKAKLDILRRDRRFLARFVAHLSPRQLARALVKKPLHAAGASVRKLPYMASDRLRGPILGSAHFLATRPEGAVVSGFSPPGDTGTWTEGPLARIAFADPIRGARTVRLDIARVAEQLRGQRSVVSINGSARCEMRLRPGRNTIRLGQGTDIASIEIAMHPGATRLGILLARVVVR